MSLPVTLESGEVALLAADASLNGITVVDGGYGTIDSFASDVTTRTVGDFVAFRKTDYVVQVSYQNADYYIIPNTQIIYKENALP